MMCGGIAKTLQEGQAGGTLVTLAVEEAAAHRVRRGAGVCMPEISWFFGIVIKMFFSDHAPPHFHAEYAEHEALVTTETLEILRGALPRRALSLVLEWAVTHRDELRADWDRARLGHSLERIAPLE